MDPVKAVALIDDKEVEVTLKTPPAGYIAESEFETRFQDKLKKRVESITKKQREELAEDDEFVQSILAKRGIDPKATPGDKKGSDLSPCSRSAGRPSMRRTGAGTAGSRAAPCSLRTRGNSAHAP